MTEKILNNSEYQSKKRMVDIDLDAHYEDEKNKNSIIKLSNIDTTTLDLLDQVGEFKQVAKNENGEWMREFKLKDGYKLDFKVNGDSQTDTTIQLTKFVKGIKYKRSPKSLNAPGHAGTHNFDVELNNGSTAELTIYLDNQNINNNSPVLDDLFNQIGLE